MYSKSKSADCRPQGGTLVNQTRLAYAEFGTPSISPLLEAPDEAAAARGMIQSFSPAFTSSTVSAVASYSGLRIGMEKTTSEAPIAPTQKSTKAVKDVKT